MMAINRQKSFLDIIQSDYNNDILSLDTVKGDLPSLRVLISQLKSTKYPSLPLFINVDKQFWNTSGYNFQYMPHMEEEATLMMHNLIPVLKFTHGDTIEDYFYPESVEAAKNDRWDDEKKRVVCDTDINMEEAEEADDIGLSIALEFSKTAAEELATTPQPSPPNKPHAYYAADDSISTLRTKGDDKTSATLPSTRFTPRPSPPSSQLQDDGLSVTSGITMETFDKVQADMAETKACLKKIMTALDIRKVSNPPDSSHNDTAGASVEDTGSKL